MGCRQRGSDPIKPGPGPARWAAIRRPQTAIIARAATNDSKVRGTVPAMRNALEKITVNVTFLDIFIELVFLRS
jgi:hypothetical protein